MSTLSMPLRVAATAAIAACLALQLLVSSQSLVAAFYATRGAAAQLAKDSAGARDLFHYANRAVPFEADRLRLEAAATRESLGAQAAVPIYAAGLRRAPYSPLLLLAAAENLTAADQPDAADEILDRVAAVMPEDWRAHHMRGLLLMKRERYADAVGEFREASQFASPFQPDVSYQLARALLATGDDTNALVEVEKSIRAQPIAPEYHVFRGKILFAQKQISPARKDFAWAVQSYQRRMERGVKALPLLLEAQDLLAQAFFAEGRFDDAQRVFEELCSRASPEQIEQTAGRVVQLLNAPTDPAPPLAFWAFALDLFVQARHLDNFNRGIELARSLYPDAEAGALVPARARALTAAGKPSDAIALLGTASSAVLDSSPYRLALAEAHAAAHQSAAARSEYAALLGMPGLSPAIRKQAQTALTALPIQ